MSCSQNQPNKSVDDDDDSNDKLHHDHSDSQEYDKDSSFSEDKEISKIPYKKYDIDNKLIENTLKNTKTEILGTKKKRYEGTFATIDEITEHFHKFNDYKESVIKTMTNEINYMQTKVFEIYTRYTENASSSEAEECLECSITEEAIECISKDMKLDERNDEEIIKLVYIFSLIMYNIGDKYLETFLQQKKSYDKSREKFLNDVVQYKISLNCISNLNTIISKNKTSSNNNQDNCSNYYKTLYLSGLHSKIASILNNDLLCLPIKKKSNNSSSSTAVSHEDYSTSIQQKELLFVKEMNSYVCEEIVNDTFTAYDFMSKLIESSVFLFGDLLELYQKRLCNIAFDDISRVFLEEFIFGIKQDPFFKVRSSLLLVFLQ